MTNSLTGDFDCVLQIGDATIDRLAATMHQNDFADTSRPTLLHAAVLRIGGSTSAERGSVNAQLGSPRIYFDDGVTDYFWVEMKVRARYWADPDSAPLAEVMNGTIRAKYRVRPMSPRCPGWRTLAKDYVRLVVDRNSVTFDGSAFSESDWFTVGAGTPVNVNDRITKQLRSLLSVQFAPEPQKVDKRFRRFRTLSDGRDRGLSAVAFPVGLHEKAPSGSLSSITRRFLGDRDFGIAIRNDYFVQSIQSALNPTVGEERDIYFRLDGGVSGGVSVDYRVRTDSIVAEWLPPSYGIGYIRITASGHGWARRLYRSGIYTVGSVHARDLRATFTASQVLSLEFDVATESLDLSLIGNPRIDDFNLAYNGLFSSQLKAFARAQIAATSSGQFKVPPNVANISLGAIRSQLNEQLGKFDASAQAILTDAGFDDDGLVIRGGVQLSRRRPPQVVFTKTDTDDGFDAFRSWIPGGFIESYRWTWRWFNKLMATYPPSNTETKTSTFYLRRPRAQLTAFGGMLGPKLALPGIDGPGQVCLRLAGRHVDPITGRRVRIETRPDCSSFGFRLLFPGGIQPYVRLYDHDSASGPGTPVGLLRLIPSPNAANCATHNTLVVYMGQTWNHDATESLRSGLAGCRRRDAGLLILVVLGDGAVDSPNPEVQEVFDNFATGLAAPVFAVDDVAESWSRLMSIDSATHGPHWRLLAPDCTLTWAHGGQITSESLSAVLDDKLLPSGRPTVVKVDSPAELGKRVITWGSGRAPTVGSCPPPPYRPNGSKLLFLHATQIDSPVVQQTLQHRPDDDEPSLAVIVIDGADADLSAAGLSAKHEDAVAIYDADGEVTRHAGVRTTPAMLVVDEFGRLTDIEPMIFLSDQPSASQA